MKTRIKMTRRCTALIALLCWHMVFQLAAAQEFEPLIQSLDIVQKTEQIANAPSGLDELLEEPLVKPQLPIAKAEEETPSAVETEVAKSLGEVTLEEKIQNQRIQSELSQYGYDFFSTVPTTFAPVTNLPVPSDYRVGPGDTVVVQLYGKKNVEYRLVVQRDGRLLIPEFGPLEVTGMTFTEVKEVVKQQFARGIIGAKAVVTMAELRTIQVILAGEAVQPGRYTVSGLATLFNALLNSGGVKRSGSLRNIQLKRLGKTVTTFDLYDLLLRGNANQDARLEHNDIIFIPAIGQTVGIGGEVQRPAIYELKNERTVGEVIIMAGGLLPTASLQDSNIERIERNRYRTLVELGGIGSNAAKAMNTRVQAGDLIRILPVADTMQDVVLLSGHVQRPGGYQFKKGKRVSDLVAGAEALLPNTDYNFALLRREIRNTKRIEVYFVDLRSVLSNPASSANIGLQARDELIIFERSQTRALNVASLVVQLQQQVEENELPMIVELRGHTRHKGRFPLQRSARLDQVIKAAGGLLPGADRDYVLIARTQPKTKKLSMFSVRYDATDLSQVEARNPIILPSDRIYVFGEDTDRAELISSDLKKMITDTNFGELSPVVFIDGPVHQPGRYPFEFGMIPADLIRAAGGLKEKAYGHNAELTHFAIYGDQYQEVQRRRLDVRDIISRQSGLELTAYDHLTLMSKPNWAEKLRVEVSGEAAFEGTYAVQQGETLCSLIQRFGGYRPNAYLHGAVFTRESVRKRQQESFDRLKGQLDDLLVQLHLSPSALNNEKMPASERNHELIKVIRQLKDKKATGRMVIDLDEAQQCGGQADIALEDGDTLHVPVVSDEVNVMGQVYYPTSHRFIEGKGSRYYIDLSGGNTVLGKLKHGYVLQANGEVESMRTSSFLQRARNIDVSAGATIYVPINVDRINGIEKAQSWAKTVFQLAFTAAIIF